MSGNLYTYAALALYFGVMLLIGYLAYLKTSDHEGYMLAGRGLPPWVAALSAGASDMSGWLIMGLPGAIYTTGLIEGWIAVGLLIGAYLNWRLVAPHLRAYTEVSRNSITLPSFFENRLRDNSRLLRSLSSIVILVFFTLYASSGMVAGGKFFESAFGGDYLTGMLLVTAVTLAYTLFGGFLGASLTDVVQGLMMVVALVVVPAVAILAIGGWTETAGLVTEVGAGNLSLTGAGHMSPGAAILVILSGLAWGLGYFGQPHIIVRFMALRTPQEARSARIIGTSWQFVSLSGAVASGLIGIAYFSKFGNAPRDAETVVLLMSQVLLHPLVAGFVLAAVLAAIMSTLSSQLIVCSSALVEDMYRAISRPVPSQRVLIVLGRAGVLVVAIIAAMLAVSPNDTILGLVAFAWAGFGAAFGPIVLLSLYWRKLTNFGALAGMVVGSVTVFVWKAMDTGLYELLPAFVLAMATCVVVSRLTYRHNEEIEREFTQASQAALGKI
ncbi:sodium/proline symporter PutP [Paracoccus sp. APAP_BH8]|nr:sodium/proline symporter PutP [Paracoccus pantotrophus]QFG36052.1 sodium/proline symporter PutP [Paracoccus pantotrophus]QLH14250.1 sodium/proline symporter PutP [Paracoccus pantotrophus]RDD94973.1 sodium/proline symporter PutP [Paracoccus pantotrophus]RNI17872.1 sodium/proline symporter PutP [Paracoccus pantotrophus]WGR67742.1 sodium/proline symporter PutP [Paracoccus pantotrophus]